MNKQDLVNAVAVESEVQVPKATAKRVLDGILQVITDTVADGETVNLVGFGTFKPVNRAARTGRNPSTGAELKIPASKSMGFKPGKTAKDIINGK